MTLWKMDGLLNPDAFFALILLSSCQCAVFVYRNRVLTLASRLQPSSLAPYCQGQSQALKCERLQGRRR
jgi:hypothetical protein